MVLTVDTAEAVDVLREAGVADVLDELLGLGPIEPLLKDPTITDILVNPQVNAAFESGKGYLSIAGNAEVVHDRAKVDEYWNPAAEAWFPEGKDDPTVALIRVRPVSAEFWARDTPGVVAVFKMAKAAMTGGQPDVGDNRAVDL